MQTQLLEARERLYKEKKKKKSFREMTNRAIQYKKKEKKKLSIFTLIPSQSISNLLYDMISSTRNLPENLEGQTLNGQFSHIY